MKQQEQKHFSDQTMIEIDSVTKAFVPRLVLKDISLEIKRGQSVCLCGVNGAGKSTLLRIVAGLLHPDKGSVRLAGYNVRTHPEQTKPRLGLISHKSMVYPDLTVSENLAFFAKLYGLTHSRTRIEKLLEQLGLTGFRIEKAGALSRGLLQRLAIARALVHEPVVLLADEPFTGLDAEASSYLVSVFTGFTASGGTLLMTTHNTTTALQCCQRVVVLDKHRAIFDRPTSQIDHQAFVKDYLSYARASN